MSTVLASDSLKNLVNEWVQIRETYEKTTETLIGLLERQKELAEEDLDYWKNYCEERGVDFNQFSQSDLPQQKKRGRKPKNEEGDNDNDHSSFILKMTKESIEGISMEELVASAKQAKLINSKEDRRNFLVAAMSLVESGQLKKTENPETNKVTYK